MALTSKTSSAPGNEGAPCPSAAGHLGETEQGRGVNDIGPLPCSLYEVVQGLLTSEVSRDIRDSRGVEPREHRFGQGRSNVCRDNGRALLDKGPGQRATR